MNSNLSTKVGLAAAGLVAGVVLAGTMGAQAATTSPSPSSGAAAATQDAHTGDNGADGVSEAQEHHGFGRGGRLDMSGTVTAVGSSSVTIKTGSGTTEYAIPSGSDKNGEAALSDLKAGDAVTFSVSDSNSKQIDKLHAGDEAKDRPAGAPAGDPADSTPQPRPRAPAPDPVRAEAGVQGA